MNVFRDRVERAMVWTLTEAILLGIQAVRGVTIAMSDHDIRLG
jgi:hypothetical protein